MSRLILDFQPIETIPDDVGCAVLRGGVMDSAAKHRPYELVAAWRDEDGRWWVGRGCEIEIIAPLEWAPAPEPIYESGPELVSEPERQRRLRERARMIFPWSR